MHTQSAMKIQQYRQKKAVASEGTISAELLNMCFNITNKMPTRKRNVDEMLEETVETVLQQSAQQKDLVADGLDSVQGVKFRKEFLPGKETDQKVLGMTDPKPDWTYGIEDPLFPNLGQGAALLNGDVELMVKVAPGLLHAFFSIEFKSCQRPIEDAENQAIRSGATLVEARRKLNARAAAPNGPMLVTSNTIQPASAPTADLMSIAFTISWVPQMAKLHVHWYEDHPGQRGIYHMTNIGAYLLARNGELQQFRNDVGNILEWGTYKRRTQVEETLRKIYPNY